MRSMVNLVVSNASASRTSLAATTLAQYVRLESCDRYLWYRLHPKDTADLFRAYRVTEQPLTPLLSLKGAVHETAVTEELEADGATVVDLSEHGVEETIHELATGRSERRVLTQARVEGRIGSFDATGIAGARQVRSRLSGNVEVRRGALEAGRAFLEVLEVLGRKGSPRTGRVGTDVPDAHEAVRVPEGQGPEQDSADEAIRTMLDHGFRHLPVVTAGRTVGVVSLRELTKAALQVDA